MARRQTPAEVATEGRQQLREQTEQLARDQWPSSLTKPEQRMLIEAGRTYNLDCAMQEVLVMGGRLWVALPGLKKHFFLNGGSIVTEGAVLEGQEDQLFEWLLPPSWKKAIERAKQDAPIVRMWWTKVQLPDDNAFGGVREAIGYGKAWSGEDVISERTGKKKKDVAIGDKWVPEMAQKRAFANAIRKVLQIAIPTLEDLAEGEKIMPAQFTLLEDEALQEYDKMKSQKEAEAPPPPPRRRRGGPPRPRSEEPAPQENQGEEPPAKPAQQGIGEVEFGDPQEGG